MKKNLLYLGLFLLCFYLGSQLTLSYYSYILYQGAKKKLEGTENVLRYGQLPDEYSRQVVKPNPDFLYVIGFYDLSEGPIRISGNMPDSTYWSISFFEPSTVNYFVKNDLEFGTSKLDITLSRQKLNTKADKEQIISPREKGLMLFRILVPDPSPEKLAVYKTLQESIKMQLMKIES
ncbi:MAG: DUF1254 domain-containing protein [Bacteroidia bacterium]|nr:DUF1254 domain-containing protein [Bacteroidia bacterium]